MRCGRHPAWDGLCRTAPPPSEIKGFVAHVQKTTRSAYNDYSKSAPHSKRSTFISNRKSDKHLPNCTVGLEEVLQNRCKPHHHPKRKRPVIRLRSQAFFWLRELDLNQRPSGYEPENRIDRPPKQFKAACWVNGPPERPPRVDSGVLELNQPVEITGTASPARTGDPQIHNL